MPVINPPENRANERVENIQPAVAIETLVLIQGRITFLQLNKNDRFTTQAFLPD